ncbi:hypothetical protein [Phascolarctobacterium faecium]|uniref:hypothetical protein n=1 Tax=Phascolarctobacterium faecium TaxID=33025 RepID=UPI0035206030
MGTLAGVKNNRFPAWWLDRGDSAVTAILVPTGNTTISGVKAVSERVLFQFWRDGKRFKMVMPYCNAREGLL